jgi:hypothetical protein
MAKRAHVLACGLTTVARMQRVLGWHGAAHARSESTPAGSIA